MRVLQIVSFVCFIVRHGRLRHSGRNFDCTRNDLLKHTGLDISHVRRVRPQVRNPVLRMMIAEAAFAKQAMRLAGGHLSTPDRKLLYVRIPKAASTSLCQAMLKTLYPSLPEDITPEQINALADVCLKRKIEGDDQAKIFTVVRNPFARLVSVYREFFQNAGEDFLYEDYLFGSLQRDVSFPEFVDAISMIPDALKDQHFKPQHCLLRYYDRKQRSVVVMKLEEADEVRRYLADHGMTFGVVHEGGHYDYRKYYDARTLEVAKTIYQKDIDRFGYTAEYTALKFAIEQRRVHS